MSTYLVAFFVFDSEFGANPYNHFNIWAQPNAIDQSKYASEIGQKSISYFSNRFNESYQLSKMDMIAVPDFAAGAMENWGLITYSESGLLYDPIESSDVAQQVMASIVVHECTHMWFGNLVTPEWWGDLWLSEAFAEYYEYFATAEVFYYENMYIWGSYSMIDRKEIEKFDFIETKKSFYAPKKINT